jgi:hypothetical protein
MAVFMAVLTAMMLGVFAQPGMAYTSFEGTCTYRGWSEFWPHRRWVPEPSGYHWRATGHCKGTLNGRPFDGPSTMDNWANMKQPMGCVVGGSRYGGPAYMTFITDENKAKTKPKKKKKKKKKKARGKKGDRGRKNGDRRSGSRARASQAQAASSEPARDPEEPTPRPPAPRSDYPVLQAWSDEVNLSNNIISDLWGAQRGYAVGYGELESGPEGLERCSGEGVDRLVLKQEYHTVRELRG